METPGPLVTVITVTYNSAAYVRDAIDSVLAQQYGNIEYIIGDDCSTDDTWEIVSGYNDPRIRAYRNETNLREYPNRNKAISKATGEYLIFIDGDDIIYPHGIGFFVEMMRRFPSAGLAIQKNYISNLLFPALLHPEESLSNFFFGRDNLLSSSFASNFFRASFLRSKGLEEKYISGDDEIRLRIAAEHDILLVAGWVSWPRETPNQASSKISLESVMVEQKNYVPDILNRFAADDRRRKLAAAFGNELDYRIARTGMHLIRSGNFHAGRVLLKKTGFSWKRAFRTALRRHGGPDPLAQYSAANPFRRGFPEPKTA